MDDINKIGKDGYTSLIRALRRTPNDLELAKKLILNGADVNIEDGNLSTPLMYAKTPEAIKLLIEAGVNVNAQDKRTGKTKLMWIFESSDPFNPDILKDTINLLVSNGANIDLKDNRGYTALLYALIQYNTDMSIMTSLCSKNNINAIASDGSTALHMALEQSNYMHRTDFKVIELFIANGADVNKTDKNKTTPLMLAVKEGNDMTIDAILKAGGDKTINTVAIDGEYYKQSALSFTTHHHMIKKLLSYGANPNIGMSDGSIKDTHLIKAYKYNGMQPVEVLLEGGADVNSVNDKGNTLLLEVLLKEYPDPEIVKSLLEQGADPNIPNNEGWTPFMYATFGKFSSVKFACSIISELIKHGADVNYSKKKSRNGNPFLIACTKNPAPEIIKLLLDNGADPNEKNSIGQTTLHLNNNTESIKLLLKAGADINIIDEKGASALAVAIDEWASANKQGYMKHIAETLRSKIEVLLECGMKIDTVDTLYRNYRTPLAHAIVAEDVALSEKLLKLGADPNKIMKNTDYPILLDYVFGNKKQNEFLQLLLNYNFDFKKIPNGYRSPLCDYLSAKNNTNKILNILLDAGIDVNKVNEKDSTPLISYLHSLLNDSGKKFSPKILDKLISLTKDINHVDMDKNSALTYATRIGNTEILKKLIEHHSILDSIDKNGWTPLMVAVRYIFSTKAVYSSGKNVRENEGAYLACINILLENGANPLLTTNDGENLLTIIEKAKAPSNLSSDSLNFVYDAVKTTIKRATTNYHINNASKNQDDYTFSI